MTPTSKGLFYAILGAFFAGLFMIFWKQASLSGSSEFMVFLLLIFAGLLNISYHMAISKSFISIFKVTKIEFICSVIICFFTILGNYATAKAVMGMSPSLLNTIIRTEVFFVIVLSYFFLKETLYPKFFVGLIVVLGGLVYSLPEGSMNIKSYINIGYGILGALSFGAISVASRWFANKIDISRVNSLRLILSILVLSIGLNHSFDQFPKNTQFISNVFAAAIFGPFLSRTCLMNSSKYIKAGLTSLTSLLIPVFTFIFSLMLLSYIPTLNEVLGTLMILVGVFISIYSKDNLKLFRKKLT